MSADFTTHLGCRVRVFEITDEGGSLPGTYLAFDMGPTDGRYAEVHLSPDDLDSLREALAVPRTIDADRFRDLVFDADFAFLREPRGTTDAMRMRSAIRAVLVDLGYEVQS